MNHKEDPLIQFLDSGIDVMKAAAGEFRQSIHHHAATAREIAGEDPGMNALIDRVVAEKEQSITDALLPAVRKLKSLKTKRRRSLRR